MDLTGLMQYFKDQTAKAANRMSGAFLPPEQRSIMPGVNERNAQQRAARKEFPYLDPELFYSLATAAPLAFHGSPYTFDKFDASKVGTGQGAQSYGHGLYFAENPATARSYVQEFSQGSPLLTVRDKAGKLIAQGDSISDDMLNAITDAEKKARLNIGYGAKQGGLASGPIYFGDLKAAYEKPVGKMYRVNIPDEHVAKMLDWDKPLSEQPQIKQVLESLVKREGQTISYSTPEGKVAAEALLNDDKGMDLYRRLAGWTRETWGADAARQRGVGASDLLNKLGIPGIKYLDQGSRNATTWLVKHPQGGINEFPTEAAARAFLQHGNVGELIPPQQTRNFVVFDPAILQDTQRMK